jgi:hypothetical protein
MSGTADVTNSLRCLPLLVAAATTCATIELAGQPTGAPPFLLSAGRAGPFEIGDSIDDVYRRVGRERVALVDLFKEGFFSPAIEIRLPDAPASPAIVADIREWPCGDFSIWGMDVRDSRFRTRDGFGVGSTVGELRRVYRVQASHAEGESVFVDALKLSFVVDDDSSKDRSRVVSVWVPPDPVTVRKRRCPDRQRIGPSPQVRSPVHGFVYE